MIRGNRESQVMKNSSLASFASELVADMRSDEARVLEDTPFRVLLLGDWSGRANRRVVSPPEELKTWRPVLIDRDNLDQLIARFGARLNLPFADDGSQSLSITFNRLDDFHPDRLFERLDVFTSLRRLRTKLEHPQTFAEAAAELRQWPELATGRSEAATPTTVEPEGKVDTATPISEANVLDQILDTSPDRAPRTKLSRPAERLSPEISKLAETAVKPYLRPDIEVEQEQMIAVIDGHIAGTMRAILSHPDFQALEAAWRGLNFLVSRVETGEELKIYLLDISFAEFNADLGSADDVRSTALYKLLVEQTVGTTGGIPWAVIAGNYTFDLTTANQQVIDRFSVIAQEAGAPFLAGVTSHLLGCESLVATPDPDDWKLPLSSEIEEGWRHLTSAASTGYVGFVLPRFLLRLPYGKQTEPTEEFDFEELTNGKSVLEEHERYLWANPMFAIVYLLARGFVDQGWYFRPSDYLDIENLPLHIYEQDGESQTKPCAETLLTVRAAEKIIDRGLMPLLSMKDSDTIRLGMCQSIAGSSLLGRWNSK
jgi:type VI secretion system protein ImpC